MEAARQRMAEMSQWQAAARRGIAAARDHTWTVAEECGRHEETASEELLMQLAEVAVGDAAAAAAPMPAAAPAPAAQPAPSAAQPAPSAAAAALLEADASVLAASEDGQVTVPLSLLRQLVQQQQQQLAQQHELTTAVHLLSSEVSLHGPPSRRRTIVAAAADPSVSLDATTVGVFELGYAPAAGSAAAPSAAAPAADSSAEGGWRSRWHGVPCNIPSSLSALLNTEWAARHYYEGVQGPAWKDREDEQREAQRLGRLPTRHTWRPGAAVRKIWHLVVNAMALVEELARQEGCSNMDAARLVDQRLAQQEGKKKKNFASLGRKENEAAVRELLGLPAKPAPNG